MDLVSSCKDKLANFRIKELKDVLFQLGLSKQGKKQDLVYRILAILFDERVSGMWAKKNAVGREEVAKLVDGTYRKMQISGATDLASIGQGVSDSGNVRLKEEIEDSYQMDKIRCPCGSSLQTDSMIKCEDPRCHVWQHIGCVIIPEKPMEGVLPAAPKIFYCELCRLIRADPFWVMVAHSLYPVKLTATNVSTDGANPVQSVEKTFQITRSDKDLLSKQEYDVQTWCMLLNDEVPFRMQWPQYADLQNCKAAYCPAEERSSLDGKRKAELVRALHEKVRLQIEAKNKQYASQANKGRRRVTFEPGDWVWVHMRKERFLGQRRSKLLPRGDGPFQICEKINDNAYKVDLPGEYNVSPTFNVSDLSHFDVGDDSRTNPFEERGNDESQARDPLHVPDGPITRARVKKIKEAMQGFVQASMAEFFKDSNNSTLSKIGFKEVKTCPVYLLQARNEEELQVGPCHNGLDRGAHWAEPLGPNLGPTMA